MAARAILIPLRGRTPAPPAGLAAPLLAGCVLAALLLAGPVLEIPLRIPLSYNEGWNAGFDLRAAGLAPGPLYPGAGSLVFDNYPPLGFLAVGWAGRLAGADPILAGRAVAFAALLACALLAGVLVRRLGGEARAGAASGLLLLLLAATFYRSYVAVDDPQFLAHAAMLAGLAVLLGGEARPRPARVAAAAALMVAGGFVKHNLVALPVATTLWLLWTAPRTGALWIACAAAAIALGAAATDAAYGARALHDILHHHRVLRAALLAHAIEGLAPLLPALLLTALLPAGRGAPPGHRLVLLFAGLAVATGIAQRAGEGVNYNAHFEALIACCLGVGLLASRPPAALARRGAGPVAVCVLAASPVLGALPWHLPQSWRTVADRRAVAASWAPVIARLARAPGPVGCEMPSLCFWAGRGFAVDLFNLEQDARAPGGSEAGARFERMVAARAFALFEDDPDATLHRDARRADGVDAPMRFFAANYRVVATGPGGVVLLAPR